MSFISRWVSSISIRYAIPGLLAILIIIAVGLTGLLASSNGQQVVGDLAVRLSREVTVRIEDHVLKFLEIPHLFHQVNLAAVEAGNLSLKDYDELRRTFYNQVDVSESAPYLYMGTEEGDFLGVDSNFGSGDPVFKVRDANSSPDRVTFSIDENGNPIEELERGEYDPRIRPWYQAAVEAGKATWSPIYVFSARPILGISPVIPIYDEQGSLYGVLGIDLTLSELTDFLRSLDISPNGQAVIIERDGNMVATSSKIEEPFTITEEGKQGRLQVTESKDPLIRATALNLLERFSNLESIADTQEFAFDFEGDRIFVQVDPVQDGRGLDWLTVVMVPARDFTGPVYDNLRRTVILGVLVLIIASVLGYVFARWIIQPIFAITDTAAAIDDGIFELEKLEPVTHRTDELGQLARVFSHMAEEVRAREQRLKRQVQQLKIEIDEAKRKQQVSEIIETDFFQDLQAKAREIRRRHQQPPTDDDAGDAS